MTDTQSRSDRAQALGLEIGRNLGSWVIDGTTSRETAARILRGFENGDPEILDMEPAALSGEWADGMTPQRLYRELGVTDAEREAGFDPIDALCTDFELAHSEGFWAAVRESAVGFFGPEILPTAD